MSVTLYLRPDLFKARKKPYGHVAHTRTMKTGKIVMVKQKGVKPVPPRVSKHVAKPDTPITFLSKTTPAGFIGDEKKLWELMTKRKVANLPEAFETARKVYGADLDANGFSSIMRDWWRNGHLTVGIPASDKGAAKRAERRAEKREVKKTGKARWKTLVNPGVVVPPPYKPKGLKINGVKATPVAEEMAYALARYLISDDPARKPDEVFLSNFAEDFAANTGIRIAPTVAAFRKAFADVIKAKKDDLAKAKPPATRSGPATPESHPHLFSKIDGEFEPIKARAASLLSGRIFTGSNKEDDGELSRKNSHRGRWCPAVQKSDIVLNGTSFPPDAKSYGECITDPTARWIYRIRVPKHVHKAGLLYTYRDQVSNEKWDAVDALVENHTQVMDAVRAGIGGEKTGELCAAIALLDSMFIRVGGGTDDEEEDGVPSKGLTDLTTEHVWLKKRTDGKIDLHFRFVAKAGEVWDSRNMAPVVCTPELANRLRKLGVGAEPAKKGERLFPNVTPASINSFLQGFDPRITAHKFRHLHGSRLFELQIEKLKKVSSQKEAQVALNRALYVVGLKLGHIVSTPEKGGSTARQYYVRPELLKEAMERLGWDLRNKTEKKNDRMELDLKKSLPKLVFGGYPGVYEPYYALDYAPPPGLGSLLEKINNA